MLSFCFHQQRDDSLGANVLAPRPYQKWFHINLVRRKWPAVFPQRIQEVLNPEDQKIHQTFLSLDHESLIFVEE